MTIKEVENRTGLPRANIRFYEKEGLITPARNGKNGYREYSEQDVRMLKTVAFLRTLDIPLEQVKKLSHQEAALPDVLQDQCAALDVRIHGMEKARSLCQRMLENDEKSLATLDVEKYINVQEHWDANRPALKRDIHHFIHWWGGFPVWIFLFCACAAVACVSFFFLPEAIPVQWNGTEVVQTIPRIGIFLYPLACLLIQFLLKPLISRWLSKYTVETQCLTGYLGNFLCFVALSLEAFTVCYIFGLCRHVSYVVITDTILFVGLLLVSAVSKKQDTPGL